MKRIIHGAEVLLEGRVQKKDVLFDENEILQIGDEIDADAEIIEAEGLTLLPGLVDVHVHFREPGHEEKETIHTGSMAAAHGGFTTVFAMPNVNPFPDDVQTMRGYLDKIQRDSIVHTHPYGTITECEQGKKLADLSGMDLLGVHWFSDDGTGMNDQKLMKQALEFSKDHDCIIACHTEDLNYRKPEACVHAGILEKKYGWKGIPGACESEPLKADLQTLAETGGHYHACHISSNESVEALEKARQAGLDVSAEVTAHHLLLEEGDVRGPMWKMNPPLRSHADRMALIEGLEKGTISFIASDHAPHTLADKNKPMSEAAFGIVSLETSFPLLYTEFVVRQKRWTLPQLVEWMSEKPAERFGLEKTGRIEEGWKSDLVLMDLKHECMVDPAHFYSKGINTPFGGWSVNARTVETIVSGNTVFREER